MFYYYIKNQGEFEIINNQPPGCDDISPSFVVNGQIDAKVPDLSPDFAQNVKFIDPSLEKFIPRYGPPIKSQFLDVKKNQIYLANVLPSYCKYLQSSIDTFPADSDVNDFGKFSSLHSFRARIEKYKGSLEKEFPEWWSSVITRYPTAKMISPSILLSDPAFHEDISKANREIAYLMSHHGKEEEGFVNSISITADFFTAGHESISKAIFDECCTIPMHECFLKIYGYDTLRSSKKQNYNALSFIQETINRSGWEKLYLIGLPGVDVILNSDQIIPVVNSGKLNSVNWDIDSLSKPYNHPAIRYCPLFGNFLSIADFCDKKICNWIKCQEKPNDLNGELQRSWENNHFVCQKTCGDVIDSKKLGFLRSVKSSTIARYFQEKHHIFIKNWMHSLTKKGCGVKSLDSFANKESTG